MAYYDNWGGYNAAVGEVNGVGFPSGFELRDLNLGDWMNPREPKVMAVPSVEGADVVHRPISHGSKQLLTGLIVVTVIEYTLGGGRLVTGWSD